MSNDEFTREDEHEVNKNIEEEEVDTDTTTDTTTDSPADEGDENIDWKAEALKYKAIANRKAKQVQSAKNSPAERDLEAPSGDELRLIAQGMDQEDIEKLKVLSKGLGVSLLEATKDDIFIAYKDKRDKERKAKQASLGASKGSATYQEKNTIKSGMTAEEHRAAWKETLNR